MKKFSFIIPAYNCSAYLKPCINNINKIGLQYYEIIIVNDGSDDDTDKVCKELLQMYSVIKYFYQENRGVSAARNYGLDKTTGDYVIFVDVDDTIDDKKLKDVLYFIGQNEDIDLGMWGISFDYYYKGKCYRHERMHYPPQLLMPSQVWVPLFGRLYSCNMISPVWNKVIRRKILVDNHIRFNENMFLYEDLEFSIRAMACCSTIYNCPEDIYHYRQTEDEGNAGRRLAHIRDPQIIINQIEEAMTFFNSRKRLNLEDEISILFKLYLVLVREKVYVSSKTEIYEIGNTFKEWIQNKNITYGSILSKKEWRYVNLVLKHRYIRLSLYNQYIIVRHKAAIILKSIGLKK